MYQLHHNPILTPYQVRILELFFATEFGKTFFLTGGTALSAFYLAHRESYDLDLFTDAPYDYQSMQAVLVDIAKKLSAKIAVKAKTDQYYELYLSHATDEWQQRIDIVVDQPVHFGNIVSVDGVRVDAIENIASNKLLTIFGRLEPKDFVDFYVIVTNSPLTLESVYTTAKQKDTGLNEFYLAHAMRQVEKISVWPDMKKSIDIAAMQSYFLRKADDLLRKIKPEDATVA